MPRANPEKAIGNRIAPPRFIAFALFAICVTPVAVHFTDWRIGAMIGFDCAAAIFLLSSIPLFLKSNAQSMRESTERNDANRVVLLAITGLVAMVILVAIAAELSGEGKFDPRIAALIVSTLLLCWLFSNLVYTFHYAHLYYRRDGGGKDSGGLEFPDCDEPDYWDFTYFSFTLGMTFQTSDVQISTRRLRRIATFHSFAAFVFNLGVLAFTINVLGGG